MNDSRLRTLGVTIALVGIALTAFLLYERSTQGPLLCATGGCETVQTSEYATVLGVPVALLGLGAYLALLGLFVARGPLVELSAVVVGIAAVLFSSYLLVIQLVVLDAVCDWCVASDVLVTGLAALALLRVRRSATSRGCLHALIAAATGDTTSRTEGATDPTCEDGSESSVKNVCDGGGDDELLARAHDDDPNA